MRVMRLLVIASLPPATEGPALMSPPSVCGSASTDELYFSTIFPLLSSVSLRAISWWQNATFAQARTLHLPRLPFALPWCLFFLLSRHSSSLRPVRENAMCFVQVAALEPGVEHGSPNTWIISSCLHCNRWAQARQAILEHNADVANKVDGLQNLCESWL